MTEKVQTIAQKLTELEQDLVTLAHCCNRDDQYEESAKLQAILIQLGALEEALVFWPAGTDWVSAEPKQLDDWQIEPIIGYALARWSAS